MIQHVWSCFLSTLLEWPSASEIWFIFVISTPNPKQWVFIVTLKMLSWFFRMLKLDPSNLYFMHVLLCGVVTLSFLLGSTASVLWSGGALGPGGVPDVTVKKRRVCPDAGTWGVPWRWPEGGADREGVPHCSTFCPCRWVSSGISDSVTEP